MKTENDSKKVLLRHLVLFKFNEGIDISILQEIEKRFALLKHEITLVKDLEWGTNISKEGLSNGFTHCFMLSFEDEKDRDAYIIHPKHQMFVAFIKEYLDKACVVDYWA